MNITQEESGKLTALVHINLKEEDYIENVNKQLKEYRRKAQMPGFRPGMVPMGMIKKMYGKAVLADEVNKTVSDALNNYLYENKINVLGNPLPNPEKTKTIDFDKDKEFDFFFDIGIAPDIEVNLDEIGKVPYYKIKVSDEEVENALEDIRKRLGKEEHPEKAELDDTVKGKFIQADEEGNPVENGHVKEEASFVISDIALKTIQKKFVSKAKGAQVVFNPAKAFKNDDKVKELLGVSDEEKLKADYIFEIEDIIRTIPAELNEEFFKQVYPSDDLKTEEDFRNRIREDLASHYQMDADKQFVSDVIDAILEKVNPELPDEFLKRWLYESNEGKATKEQIDGQYDSYAKTFKWQLIEQKLIEATGDALKVTREDVRNKLRSYFQIPEGDTTNPQAEQLIDQLLSNEQEYNRIFGELMDQRYIAFFKEKIEKDEKEVTTDEFVKIISTPKA
ncbi:trigger factor [Candidatus Sulfidibacterium hydrothermale]|uniref:trigger factor n=1 Tax=Candidatus Sulfidibacterium hydrothermale TaxID=2875962 RepID=UPI001F0B427E|nr:trigger factor [Candidatus Sulfidibacterium hydrothermale]UBM62053.1 trigger factor [Candidatus Sulfidibacterium hydrothermale]